MVDTADGGIECILDTFANQIIDGIIDDEFEFRLKNLSRWNWWQMQSK